MVTKTRLNPHKKPGVIQEFDVLLKESIIGQEHALDKVSKSLCKLYSGLRNNEKPVLTMLFLGSSGVGKTETVKCLSEYFFGNRSGFTRVNCQEYSQEHTVSRLIGSPPGYIGREIEPLLSQRNLDKHWKEAKRRRKGIFRNKTHKIHRSFDALNSEFLNIILFDEIEKAHPVFWTKLLGILDDGNLILADNKEVNFRNSIIIITSNIGSYDINEKLSNKFVGFEIDPDKTFDIEKIALDAAKNEFPPEFLNRFDSVVVFNPLTKETISRIFDKEFNKIEILLKSKTKANIVITEAAKSYLIDKGYSIEMGARNLSRILNDLVVNSLASLLSNDDIQRNDTIQVDLEDSQLVFDKLIKATRKSTTRPKRVKAKSATI